MKLFLAYKFSGENKEKLKSLLEEASMAIEDVGYEMFIHWRDVENWGGNKFSSKEVINGALNEIKGCDAVLALVTSPKRSEGMLLEVGYGKGIGKKIIVAARKECRSAFLEAIADEIIEFEDVKDLADKIRNIKP